jgi:hypothetical protein
MNKYNIGDLLTSTSKLRSDKILYCIVGIHVDRYVVRNVKKPFETPGLHLEDYIDHLIQNGFVTYYPIKKEKE